MWRIDLSGADLRGADLSGAILRRANLSGADLSGAFIKGKTGLTGDQLSLACAERDNPPIILPRSLSSTWRAETCQ